MRRPADRTCARLVRIAVGALVLAALGSACAGGPEEASAVTGHTGTTSSTVDAVRPLEIRESVQVDVAGTVLTLSASTLRSWLTRTAPDSFDPSLVAAGLRTAAGPHTTSPVDATFVVNAAGAAELVPARPGSECCDPSAADVLLQAVRSQTPGPVAVPLRALVPAFGDDEARALGIVSSVAAFKTSHACCEGRVANIHRISDLLRGVVIPPDGTFSVNDLIGPRTKAKGFVAAPVITNHEHDTAVGGGISQFATTLFNAAFFAGLDLVEYQSHSLYISRYPYGREATLSYPAPDLKLHNPTSHGVLIWPTYTDTSLSVALYSTPWFRSVTQGAQRKTSRGTCTVVETPRTRVLPDGRPVTDVISAVYHQEGQPCSGGRPHVQ